MRGPRSLILPGDPEFENTRREMGVVLYESRIVTPDQLVTVDSVVEPPSGPLLADFDSDPTFRQELDMKFPVRMDVEVMAADSESQRKIGWAVYESVGIGAFNPRRMKIETVPCPVCGEKVADLHLHARRIDDLEHGILNVMIS